VLIAACGGTTSGGGNPRSGQPSSEQAPNERAQASDRAGRRAAACEPDEKYADALLAQVGQLAVSREITSVKARLQRMNPVEEQAGYNRMFGDLVGLEKRRKALLDRAAGA
jgi:DNA primase